MNEHLFVEVLLRKVNELESAISTCVIYSFHFMLLGECESPVIWGMLSRFISYSSVRTRYIKTEVEAEDEATERLIKKFTDEKFVAFLFLYYIELPFNFHDHSNFLSEVHHEMNKFIVVIRFVSFMNKKTRLALIKLSSIESRRM